MNRLTVWMESHKFPPHPQHLCKVVQLRFGFLIDKKLFGALKWFRRNINVVNYRMNVRKDLFIKK